MAVATACFQGSGVAFAQNLIRLYTEAMGSWAAWIIVPAAFAAMFSTTLTCLDAYPRSISAIQGLLQGVDRGDSAPGPQRRRLGTLDSVSTCWRPWRRCSGPTAVASV